MSTVPFDKKELAVVGEYPVVESDFMTIPGFFTSKLSTPITPKENWKRFFERKDPLWVPDGNYDFNFCSPRLIPDNQACSHEGGFDNFGVEWVPDSDPQQPAFIKPGLHLIEDVADWREIKFPDIDNWAWDEAADEYKVLDPDRMNAVFSPLSFFERMTTFMGFENAAAAFLEDPDATHALLDRLVEFNIELFEHYRKYLGAELVLFSDDWGSQLAPFFSRDVVEEFLVPRMTTMVKRAHELDMLFMHHCCGNVVSFVPYMIEEGIDSWEFNFEAVEAELPATIAKYGDKIMFDGYFGFLNPIPPDEKVFQEAADGFYATYGSTGSCSVTVYDFNEWDFDSRAYCYEAARKALGN